MPADSPHPPRPIVRGRRFATPNPEAVHHSFADAARWMARRRPGAWPRTVDVTPTVPRARVGPGELVATWVGHTTVLVQVDGVNVLTDPIWSARCSPVQWAGPKRVAAPGVRLDDLPPIDVVVISHDHYDHLDAATVKQLAAAHPECTFVVPVGVDRRLSAWGIHRCIAATWWDACEIAGLRITCTPAQHFSGRTAFDRDTTLWATWMLEPKQGGAVWFGGDTGWFDAGFRAMFSGSPIKRIGRDRFVRNVLYAIGNSGDMGLADVARGLCSDPDAAVADAACWAVERLQEVANGRA